MAYFVLSMMMRTKPPDYEELTPWYVNQTLTRGEIGSFGVWIEKHPEAKEEISFWEDIQDLVGEQTRYVPAPGILRETKARIHSIGIVSNSNRPTLRSWITGLMATLLVFTLLWWIVKPGITLHWSVSGDLPATFRVYRAPVGSDDYRLLGEVSSKNDRLGYQFVDLLYLPGRSYSYRVQGINQAGGIAFSKAVTSDTLSILPGQISIMITSIIMGYVCLSLLNIKPGRNPRRADGAVA